MSNDGCTGVSKLMRDPFAADGAWHQWAKIPSRATRTGRNTYCFVMSGLIVPWYRECRCSSCDDMTMELG